MLGDTLPRQRTLPTLAWTGAGALALIVAQLLGVLLCILALRLTTGAQLHLREMAPTLLGSVVLSAVWTILFVWGLTRIRTPDVGQYLALRWPSARQFGIGIV